MVDTPFAPYVPAIRHLQDASDDTFEMDLQTVQDRRDLIRRHDTILARSKSTLEKWDRYYEGNVPLKYMAPAISAEFGDRIGQLILNIAKIGVESYENRLDIDGIRLDPNGDADDDESQSWRDMDMDWVATQVHLEALALGRSYAQVGINDDGDPVVTPESPFQMTTIMDPLRQTKSAVKRWKQDDGKTQMRTLYLPNETINWVQSARTWVLFPDAVDSRDVHDLGRVPVFTFLHGSRVLQDTGDPIFKVIVPIYEALNKIATDMMVAAEFHALPRRWALNVAKEDFEDENGKPISPLEQIIGAVWAVPGEPGGEKVELGQFDASDLANFHNTIKMLMQIGGHLMGLPAQYTSFATANPAAEGAIRASEIQLTKGSERIITSVQPPWKRTWQTVRRIRDGSWDELGKHMQIIFRDTSTPTVAQKADAISKLVSTSDKSGKAVVPVENARELMGFSSSMRDSMAANDKKAASASLRAIKDTFAATEPQTPPPPPPGQPGQPAPGQPPPNPPTNTRPVPQTQ